MEGRDLLLAATCIEESPLMESLKLSLNISLVDLAV